MIMIMITMMIGHCISLDGQPRLSFPPFAAGSSLANIIYAT